MRCDEFEQIDKHAARARTDIPSDPNLGACLLTYWNGKIRVISGDPRFNYLFKYLHSPRVFIATKTVDGLQTLVETQPFSRFCSAVMKLDAEQNMNEKLFDDHSNILKLFACRDSNLSAYIFDEGAKFSSLSDDRRRNFVWALFAFISEKFPKKRSDAASAPRFFWVPYADPNSSFEEFMKEKQLKGIVHWKHPQKMSKDLVLFSRQWLVGQTQVENYLKGYFERLSSGAVLVDASAAESIGTLLFLSFVGSCCT